MLTNEQYAVRVADAMGTKMPTKEEFDGDCHVCLPYYPLPRKPAIQYGSTWENPRGNALFDPSDDPASALVWETWLRDHAWDITKNMRNPSDDTYRDIIWCSLRPDLNFIGQGKTPLLALKAASEKFLEENK